ncbi:MAG: alpha/beta hydrolase [Mycobacteriaceae bacterium]
MPAQHSPKARILRRQKIASLLVKKGLTLLGLALLTISSVIALPITSQALPSTGLRSDEWVYSASMDRWIKVQVQWAKRGGNAALYLLDGLRARDDWNGWDINTDAFQQFAENNLTIVMPVGGQSSFYTDWYAPSSTNGQTYTYKWETFLTKELPIFLEKHGVSPHNNGIVGLSMGGGSAFTLAAYHRDQFKFAGSFSGDLHITSLGMRGAIRVSMLDAGGYNVDNMWGAPWDAKWVQNDPFMIADRLRGMSLYASAASGLPGPHDHPSALIDYWNTSNGMAIEAVVLSSTRSFQAKANAIGLPVTYDFPSAGIHSWRYWQDQLWKARPQILDALQAW